MKLDDGIFEIKDLFLEDCGFFVAVAQNDIRFMRDSSVDARLKLEVAYPDLDFSKPVAVPKNFSSERGAFMKSMLKSIFASAVNSNALANVIADFLDALDGCSLFEATYFMTNMQTCGLRYSVPRNEYLSYENVVSRGKFGQIQNIMSKTIMFCPNYRKFRESFRLKHNSGNGDDLSLKDKLLKTPWAIKEYLWTKEDAEESLAIAEANPFLSQYI